MSEIKLSPDYWDCECEKHFIHPRSDERCPICGADQEDMPDSRVNEIGLPKTMYSQRVKP